MKDWWRLHWQQVISLLFLLFVGGPFVVTSLYRFVPPPVTPLMVIRSLQGHGLDKTWRSLDDISPNLRRAVIAAEDGTFCTHWGFNWDALSHAIARYGKSRRVRGASTIPMQTAKNLFLWPGRTFIRKGLEAYLTIYLEALWPKRRILEVYLNVIEFGPGLYGAEAAARQYFGKSAAALTQREAALMAAVLPKPLGRSPADPSDYVLGYAATIEARIPQIPLGSDGACRGIGE